MYPKTRTYYLQITAEGLWNVDNPQQRVAGTDISFHTNYDSGRCVPWR